MQHSTFRFIARRVVTAHMDNTNSTESPLEAAAGTAGSHVTAAFELLSNEIRLSILLALWEPYDPYGTNNVVAFSELLKKYSPASPRSWRSSTHASTWSRRCRPVRRAFQQSQKV